MTRSRPKTRCFLCALLATPILSVGCTSPGPITSHRTMVGGLKASVVSLESENEQLRRQVADLKSENRATEDQLIAERSHSDDLATRLDNARHLLGKNTSLDREVSGRSDLDGTMRSSASAPTAKARRSSRTPRTPPSAAIPGPLEPSSNGSSVGDDHLWEPQAARTVKDDVWLPIARGTGTAVKR